MPPRKRENKRKNSNPIQQKIQLDCDIKNIDFEVIKAHLLDIESFYTDTSLNFSREWDIKEKRDKFIEDVKKAKTVEEVAKLLL